MKDFEPHNPIAPIQQHEERQQEQKYRLLGALVHKPGLTLWEYNRITKSLVRATILKSKTEVLILTPNINARTGKPIDHTIGKVQYNPDCDYFESLNFNSALRKVDKILKGQF